MTSTVILVVGGLLASAGLTWLAIGYAHRRRMLDLPGARRSHDRPTPRGGGIAPVLVVLGGGAWLAQAGAQPDASMLACLGGLALVAAIGWVDDHRPLSPVPRLAVHLAAAALATLALFGMPHGAGQLVLAVVVVFAVAGLVNAWNFMDGIDGLATTQAGLVMAALLAGGWMAGTWQALDMLALAAVAGFLPFNTPRARIFLGDVGSGALGYLVAVLLLQAVRSGGMPWSSALLAVSAFLIDAGMTLLSRMMGGKAWWRPHREHLYQWLVRSGRTHAGVTGRYALWTIAACGLAVASASWSSAVRLPLMVAAIISGLFFWAWSRKHLWLDARSPH